MSTRRGTPGSDAEIAEAIRCEGAPGATWRRLECEVVKECRRNFGWRHATPEIRDRIDLAVAEGCVWLRDAGILGGQWDPSGGATLVGSAWRRALSRFWDHSRRWAPEVRTVTLPDPDELVSPLDTADEALDLVRLGQFRDHVGDRAAWAVGVHACGWRLDEIAQVDGASVRATSTLVWRARSSWREHGW